MKYFFNCSLSIIIDTGSVDEEEDSSGVAHFLEHMHFKGTHKRNISQLDKEIESKGGSLDAFTTRDNTMFSMNIYKDDLEWGLELLSDIFLNSIYRDDLIQKEKSTIYSELLDCQKDEYTTNLELSHNTSFEGYSVGRPILGLKADILNMNREKIVRFHKNNYFGGNIALLAVGNVNHEKFVEYTEKYFGQASKDTPENNKHRYQKKFETMWRDSSSNNFGFLNNNNSDFLNKNISNLSSNFGMETEKKQLFQSDSFDRHSGLNIFKKEEMMLIDGETKNGNYFKGIEERPIFSPNMMLIQGEDHLPTKIGIYYDAPTWFDPEMYTFLILQRMIGRFSFFI